MDATNSPAADFQRQQDRKRKRKALLAGGVVLGLGAAMTLAAWSDDVIADGIFNTGGTFELQGSTDGSTFRDYDEDTPNTPEDPSSAALNFSFTATEMTPGQTIYAPFTVATSSETAHNGTFNIQDVVAAGKYKQVLRYQVYRNTDPNSEHGEDCSAGGVANLTEWTDPVDEVLDYLDALPVTGLLDTLRNLPVVGPLVNSILNVDLLSRSVNDPFLGNLTTGPLPVSSAGNNPQHLCIAVTMGLPPIGVTLPIGTEINISERLNSTIVNAVDTAAGDDVENTTVKWTFTGESTN